MHSMTAYIFCLFVTFETRFGLRYVRKHRRRFAKICRGKRQMRGHHRMRCRIRRCACTVIHPKRGKQ